MIQGLRAVNEILVPDGSGYPTVVSIVPAHNEEATICESVRSLYDQTQLAIVRTIVIADNCTDQTYAKAKALELEFESLIVVRSKENRAGKSGAMNQAFSYLLDVPVSYVVQIDGDTVLKKDSLKNAIGLLEENKSLGAVCARFGLLPPPANADLVGRTLWRLQNLEFGFRDVATIQSFGKNTSLLSGRASVFRYEILQSLYEKKGYVWNEHCKVEDHAITIDVKSAGWRTAVSMNMKAATSVPLTFREWLNQRLRWYVGTIELLLQKRASKHTRKDSLALLLFFLWFPLRLGFFIWLVLLVCGVEKYEFHLFYAGLAFLLWGYQMIKLKFIRDRDVWQTAFVASILVYEFYCLMRDFVLLASFLSLIPSAWNKRGGSHFSFYNSSGGRSIN